MMSSNQSQAVQDFLQDIQTLNVDFYEIVKQVSTLYIEADSTLVQAIKYGGLVFLKDNQLIAGIFCYKAHISLEFSEGALLKDPQGVLVGKGKQRRHIKITNKAQLANLPLTDLITQASELD